MVEVRGPIHRVRPQWWLRSLSEDLSHLLLHRLSAILSYLLRPVVRAGFWLAIKSACPIFIKRSVWDECSTEVEAEGGGGLDEALATFRAIRCTLPRAATWLYLCPGINCRAATSQSSCFFAPDRQLKSRSRLRVNCQVF